MKSTINNYPEIREAVRALCAEFSNEYHRKIDEERGYPEEFVNALTEAGWLAAMIPEEYGGSGLGLTEASIIMEEINRSGGNAGACHGQMYNMGTLLRHGSKAQKELYLPKIATGEWRLQSMGVTEPTTGTDTTKEEYIGAKIDGTIGEIVTEGTIESDKTAVTYQVTEGFTFRGNESDENRVYDIYINNVFDQVYLFLIEYDGDAKAYTEEHYLFNGKLNTFEKNGRTYYYNEEHEKTADYDATRIIAATDAGNGMLYIVDLDTARNMQIGDVEEFFDIKIK